MIDLAFDIDLQQGEFVLDVTHRARVEVLGVMGASGAGKTTLLETLAGLRTPDRGAIEVAGTTWFSSSQRVNLPPRLRRVGYVPQDALLFPHLSVRGNLTFGAGRGASTSTEIDSLAKMLEIVPLLDRAVHGLSGGERQRVALGRALMTHPALLLMDEPLAAVDKARRDRILPYLLRIRRDLHVPLVYVTHDRSELEQIADRVLVLEGGRVVG